MASEKSGMGMQKFAKQSGYFLVLMMCFINLFSLVALNQFSRLKNEMTSVKRSWQINVENLISEYLLSEIEVKLAKKQIACIISQQSSDQLRQHDRLWWQTNGCVVNSKAGVYRYVVERVMHDACAVSADMVTAKSGMTYYRISLLRNQSLSILQSITAVYDDTKLCAGSRHVRLHGRQSWREL